MSFDWREYAQLAANLADPGSRSTASAEARQRAAVSRAYYAGFCMARNWLAGIATDLEVIHQKRAHSTNLHRTVPRKFIGSKNAALVQVGSALLRMRVARNFADYDDVLPAGVTSEDLADDALADVALVLNVLDVSTKSDFY